MQSIEIEVKFRVRDRRPLKQRSTACFHCETPPPLNATSSSTHPTIACERPPRFCACAATATAGCDSQADHAERLTEARTRAAHKERIETETAVEDGEAVAAIFKVLANLHFRL